MRGVGGVKKRGALALLLWAAMALLLTGCLFRPPDELYRRPERSAGYDQLAAAIRSVKTGLEGQFGVSCEDAVIVAGDNTASIQLQDLDGDGQRESAVAFIRVPGVEKSLKIISLPPWTETTRSGAWWKATARPSTRWTMWT